MEGLFDPDPPPPGLRSRAFQRLPVLLSMWHVLSNVKVLLRQNLVESCIMDSLVAPVVSRI